MAYNLGELEQDQDSILLQSVSQRSGYIFHHFLFKSDPNGIYLYSKY